MRWSIEELIKDLQNISNRYMPLMYRIKNAHRSLYRKLRSIFYWIFTGKGYTTSWNTGYHIVNNIVYMLENFVKLDKQGYPAIEGVSSPEDFNDIIRHIIQGISGFSKVYTGEDAPGNDFKEDFLNLGLSKYKLSKKDISEGELAKLKQEYQNYIDVNTAYYTDLMRDYVKSMEQLTALMIQLWD